ncbi:hypothetical protein CPB84DRAFT_1852726 [Gymnopilus junonius]|uniref:Uncharacterized protein n=1 Tax=Gymnopilus junonius TaxID=109634 RepID=A0A9P5N9W2_GYMJU|nr:hypothetical protein CPB84DRAFT_1852726 [Gymnopilus junonius]
MSTNSGKPSKVASQWHTAKGEVKEGIGRTFASLNLQQGGVAERPGSNDGYSNKPSPGSHTAGSGTLAGAKPFAGGPDYGTHEPVDIRSTGSTGEDGTSNVIDSRSTPGNAHLANDKFTAATGPGPGTGTVNTGTAAAYNEFEPTGTSTLDKGSPVQVPRGETHLQAHNAREGLDHATAFLLVVTWNWKIICAY